MSRLHLPPKVRQELEQAKWAEQRAERRAVLFSLLDFDDRVCKTWQPELKRLDPFLTLARARPMAYEPGFHVRPGYYHWVRDNPTTDLTVQAITGPDGESFSEPDSSLLEALKRNDLQDPVVWRAIIERRASEEAERERAQQAERDRVTQEVLERYAAGTRTQVLMSSDVPWTQNSAGRRRRDVR